MHSHELFGRVALVEEESEVLDLFYCLVVGGVVEQGGAVEAVLGVLQQLLLQPRLYLLHIQIQFLGCLLPGLR